MIEARDDILLAQRAIVRIGKLDQKIGASELPWGGTYFQDIAPKGTLDSALVASNQCMHPSDLAREQRLDISVAGSRIFN